MSHSILWIADEWETLDHAKDSTLHLTKTGIEDFGLEFHYATSSCIFLSQDKLFVKPAGKCLLNKDGRVELDASHTHASTSVDLNDFHSIHWRQDPPVGLCTYQLWSLLSQSDFTHKFINPPMSLYQWSEKLSPLRYHNWSIPFFLSSSMQDLMDHAAEQSSSTLILKPMSEAASRGVIFLSTDAHERKRQIELHYKTFGPWLIMQSYDESIEWVGETRVFILNGKIQDSLVKKTSKKKTILNLDAPEQDQPTLSLTELNQTQKIRAEKIAADLHASGIYIATVDFIGDRILEINVTSPGLIQWVDNARKNKAFSKAYWENLDY